MILWAGQGKGMLVGWQRNLEGSKSGGWYFKSSEDRKYCTRGGGTHAGDQPVSSQNPVQLPQHHQLQWRFPGLSILQVRLSGKGDPGPQTLRMIWRWRHLKWETMVRRELFRENSEETDRRGNKLGVHKKRLADILHVTHRILAQQMTRLIAFPLVTGKITGIITAFLPGSKDASGPEHCVFEGYLASLLRQGHTVVIGITIKGQPGTVV